MDVQLKNLHAESYHWSTVVMISTIIKALLILPLRYLCIFQSLPTYGVHYYEVKVRKSLILMLDINQSSKLINDCHKNNANTNV